MSKTNKIANTLLTAVLTVLSLAWVYPVVMILLNSLKKESAITTSSAFQLPDGSSLSYYAAIGFTDLVLHGDGSVEATSDSGYAAYGNIDVLANGEYYNFTGFETLEDMNKECIDGYAGMYAVESNVTEG